MTQDEALKELQSRAGRRRLLARAVSMVAMEVAERIDVERSKALRQCVELAGKWADAEELPKLAARMESAAKRMEAARRGDRDAGADPQPDPESAPDLGGMH